MAMDFSDKNLACFWKLTFFLSQLLGTRPLRNLPGIRGNRFTVSPSTRVNLANLNSVDMTGFMRISFTIH